LTRFILLFLVYLHYYYLFLLLYRLFSKPSSKMKWCCYRSRWFWDSGASKEIGGPEPYHGWGLFPKFSVPSTERNSPSNTTPRWPQTCWRRTSHMWVIYLYLL